MPKLKRVRASSHTSDARRIVAWAMIGALVLVSAFTASITHRNFTFEPLSTARAQEHDHLAHSSGQASKPLLDGAVDPEVIPDDVAIRVLLNTLRVSPDPGADAIKTLRTRISRANLSEADFQTILRELGKIDTAAKSQEARILAFRPTAAANRADVDRYLEEREVLNALFVDQYQQLLLALSSEGADKLRAHLLHVKSRTKIFPAPDMSSVN